MTGIYRRRNPATQREIPWVNCSEK